MTFKGYYKIIGSYQLSFLNLNLIQCASMLQQILTNHINNRSFFLKKQNNFLIIIFVDDINFFNYFDIFYKFNPQKTANHAKQQ